MNKKYNYFYFLNIEKTIGRTIPIHLINNIIKVCSMNGIPLYNKQNTPLNRMPEYIDDKFILTFLRDPIRRSIAEYAYSTLYSENGEKKHNSWRDISSDIINEDTLKLWVEKKFIPNYQTLILSNGSSDLNVAVNNLNKIDFKIKCEEIFKNELKIQNKVMETIGIPYSFTIYNSDFEQEFYEDVVGMIMHKYVIGTNIYEFIYENSKDDYVLYNMADAFSSR